MPRSPRWPPRWRCPCSRSSSTPRGPSSPSRWAARWRSSCSTAGTSPAWYGVRRTECSSGGGALRNRAQPVPELCVRERMLAARELPAQLADRPEPLGQDVVVVDRLEVDLAGEDEVVVGQLSVALESALHHQADRILDEPGREVRVLDDEELVRALEELVDRGAHRALHDPDQILGVEARGGPEEEGSPPALVVRGERDELEDAFDVSAVEARFGEAVRSFGADEALRARAGVDARRLHADDAPGGGSRGGGDPHESDELLRAESSYRSQPLDRVARGDLHLGAEGMLSLDDVARDALREVLDEQLLVDHDLVDGLLEDLGEARHVDAFLGWIEIDEALDVGRDERVPPPMLHPDGLLHARHPGAGKADTDFWGRGL